MSTINIQKQVLTLLDASSLSERFKNSYRAIVYFLPDERIIPMIEKLKREKEIQEKIHSIQNTKLELETNNTKRSWKNN